MAGVTVVGKTLPTFLCSTGSSDRLLRCWLYDLIFNYFHCEKCENFMGTDAKETHSKMYSDSSDSTSVSFGLASPQQTISSFRS